MAENQHRESDSRKSSAPDSRTQAEKFADLARELECDEDEAAFDEKLKKLAKAQLAPKAPKSLPPEQS
jgi:hypothetical protein